MEKYYVDKWGELHEALDKTEWVEFKPWDQWKNQFDWIECSQGLKEQDMIAWRDTVITAKKDGSKNFNNGARLVIGRICNIENDRHYIEVVFSDGESPLSINDKISRKTEWLTKFGTYRFPRDGEDDYAASEHGSHDPHSKRHPKLAEFIENSTSITLPIATKRHEIKNIMRKPYA